jgi:ABC-type multidrug transport system fused ATPase/permease subunit
LSLLVVLQLVNASLYLNLNAAIIDEGVPRATRAISRAPVRLMLAISFLQILASVYAVYLAARTAMSFGRDLRARVFHRVGEFSAREVAQFGAPTLISRRPTTCTQVQMVVFMMLAMMVGAPIMMVGGVIMALAQDVGLSWLVAVASRCWRHRRADRAADAAAVPGHAGLHRLGQPDPARADHRHPGRAGVRARGRRAGAVRRGQHDATPARRWPSAS